MEQKLRKLKKVVIREELYAITNDTMETILLGQLIYWQDKVRDVDKYINEEKLRLNQTRNGWIYKTSKQIIEECMLSFSEVTVRRHLQKLVSSRYISSRRNPKYKWDKTFQYRVNLVYIVSKLKEIGYNDIDFDFINNNTYKSYNDQLKDMRWKKLANKIRKRDRYTCQMCGNHKKLQVHHKHYIKGRLAWEYEDNNFITLCRDCHKGVHNIK